MLVIITVSYDNYLTIIYNGEIRQHQAISAQS